MSAVGLFYVGAVLFINGLMFLGRISAKSAGIFNILVGGLQCVMPLMILAQSGGDVGRRCTRRSRFPLRLHLSLCGYRQSVGNLGEGIGWFSLFVAGLGSLRRDHSFFAGDLTFGVIWLAWGILWLLFRPARAGEVGTYPICRVAGDAVGDSDDVTCRRSYCCMMPGYPGLPGRCGLLGVTGGPGDRWRGSWLGVTPAVNCDSCTPAKELAGQPI